MIYDHGSDAVRALLATGAANLWTAPQLHDVLFTTRCEFCGDHGEILQLQKLKRCCMRCLSQERELLAVSADYALFCMGLAVEDIERIPHLRSVHQMSHDQAGNRAEWGNDTILDYTAALGIAGDRVDHYSHVYQAQPNHTYDLTPTGHNLDEKHRSLQPLSQRPIHQRRGHASKLRLPPCIISPPETEYRQHASAIRLPALTFKTWTQDGQPMRKVARVDAVHCQGCAFYWNLHCPMPHMYHKLYPHDDSGNPTEFTQHLRYCFYAHCHFTRINNPWDRVDLWVRIQLLEVGHTGFVPRHTLRTLEESNVVFEMISARLARLLDRHNKDYRFFQRPYEWPAVTEPADIMHREEEYLTNQRLRRRIKDRSRWEAENQLPSELADAYWDMLVGQETAGQANWACAHLHNGSFALFRGPERWLMSKRERYNRKYWCEGTKDFKQHPWGFDRF